HPYLALFDGPDTNTTTEQRSNSTVPQQALFLMNNPFVTEQAEGLARRLIASSADPRERIALGCELAWARPARPIEVADGTQYVREYAKHLSRADAPADRVELEAWTSFSRILLSANEFVYID